MCCGGVRKKRKGSGKACIGARGACNKIRGRCEGRGVMKSIGERERDDEGGIGEGGPGPEGWIAGRGTSGICSGLAPITDPFGRTEIGNDNLN